MTSTWDTMSEHDRQACEDAGRREPSDPRELADMANDEQRDRGEWTRTRECPNGCGTTLSAVIAHRRGAYYVDLVCLVCGQTVDPDEEGGV